MKLVFSLLICIATMCSCTKKPVKEESPIIEANYTVVTDSISSMKINSDGVAHIVLSGRMYYCVDKDTQEAIEQAIISNISIELIATKTRASIPKLMLR